MTGLSQGTWVLIADGEKALILENTTDAENPHLEIVRKKVEENPPDREQATDKPGRMHDSGPNQRSGVAETDFHQIQKDRFADDLADLLYGYAHKGRFERIVLVASPHVLGVMRQSLHKEVSSKVVGEVSKTLTNHPVDEIEKIVAAELAA